MTRRVLPPWRRDVASGEVKAEAEVEVEVEAQAKVEAEAQVKTRAWIATGISWIRRQLRRHKYSLPNHRG
jgi:hypothetical protein